jgi:hypothetical protein
MKLISLMDKLALGALLTLGATGAFAQDMEALPIELPEAFFGGTPLDYWGPNLEPEDFKDRAPFMAPKGTVVVSKGKPVTSSTDDPLVGELKQITDGDKDYTKSTPEQQEQLMHDCIVQFIMGYLSTEDKPFTQKAAERILSQSRDDRTKDAQDAYYKGYSKFRYHIIRPENAPESSGRKVKVLAPRAVFKAVLNEVLESGMTKAQFEALITELRDSVVFK